MKQMKTKKQMKGKKWVSIDASYNDLVGCKYCPACGKTNNSVGLFCGDKCKAQFIAKNEGI